MKKHGLSKLLAVVVAGMVLNAYAAERVVVKGDYDLIEGILTALGWDYALIGDTDQLLNYDLSEVKQLYINCGVKPSFQPTSVSIAKVKEWVEAGGYLYASDWSAEYIEGWGLEFKKDGKISDTVATVEDPGLKSHIGSELVGGTLSIQYDQPNWRRISNTAHATVLLRGDAQTFSGTVPNSPLAVILKAGKGRAIYTTFHNEEEGIPQPGMKKAIEYFAMMPQAQAAGDELVGNKGLDSNNVVGFAIGTLEQAASNGVGIQGIPAGFDGKYLFQVTNMLIKSPHATTLSAAGNYTLQLLNSKGAEYKSLPVSGNETVEIDVPAADNDGNGWTFKISNASGYESNQSVIAVSWKGDYKGSAGGGEGGEGGAGVGGSSISKSSSSSGCNTVGGPLGLIALAAFITLMSRRKF